MFYLAKTHSLIICVFCLLAGTASPSTASKMVRPALSIKTVNVNISFSTQTKISDFDESAIQSLRHAARTTFYKSTTKECLFLMETIAATCNLASLNFSTRLNEQQNGTTSLYINGSARFAITLKNRF